MSRIAQSVPLLVDGVAVSTIEKGEYFTCPVLTAHLRKLFGAVQDHVRSKGG